MRNPFIEEIDFWITEANEAREEGAPQDHIDHFEAMAEAARDDAVEWDASRRPA